MPVLMQVYVQLAGDSQKSAQTIRWVSPAPGHSKLPERGCGMSTLKLDQALLPSAASTMITSPIKLWSQSLQSHIALGIMPGRCMGAQMTSSPEKCPLQLIR